MFWVGTVAKEGQKTGEKRQPAANSVNESESHLRHHHPLEKSPLRSSLMVTNRDDKWLNGRDPKEGTPGWVRDHGHVSSPLRFPGLGTHGSDWKINIFETQAGFRWDFPSRSKPSQEPLAKHPRSTMVCLCPAHLILFSTMALMSAHILYLGLC